MRVLYFTQSYSPHDRRFTLALVNAGVEVNYLPLVTHRWAQAHQELHTHLEVERPLLDAPAMKWWKIPKLIGDLESRIEQINPDLVHAGPIHLGSAIAALARVHPLVSMSWGSDLLREARKPLAGFVSRVALRNTDMFVGDCEAVRTAAIRLGMDENRIILFPWGVDRERFSPGSGFELRTKMGWQDKVILLSSRSLEPLYGVDLLIKAFIRSARRVPSLRLLILGEGSQRHAYQQWLQAAGFGDRAHFAGLIAEAELPGYYRAADVYVSASHSDGSSVSLLEAMASGLPSLVSDIPGNREWIQHGINGWWFRSGEVTSLSVAIENAIQDRSLLKRLGERARETTKSRADWSKNFPRLLDAYQLALDHAHRRDR